MQNRVYIPTRNCYKPIRYTKVGEPKVMGYGDITEVQAQHGAKEIVVLGEKREAKREAKRKSSRPVKASTKRLRESEVEEAGDEIEEMGLGDYDSVLSF